MLSCPWINLLVPRTIFLLLFAASASGQLTPAEKKLNLDSFEKVWSTVRDRHPDPALNGLDWKAVHDSTLPRIAGAESADEVRTVLREMLYKLGASHYSIIPSDRYLPSAPAPTPTPTPAPTPAPASSPAAAPAAEAGQPPAAGGGTRLEVASALLTPAPAAATAVPESGARNGETDVKIVRFANLPEQRIYFQSRKLPGGAGYIRFNEFLDPVSIIPKVEAALHGFARAPGIVIDLRGNPGGIGLMAMGVAGFFISEEGHLLGTMVLRDATLKFMVFPRPEIYSGPLAVLVDGGSASTAEIFAQGMQDLGRARIFGQKTAGAALPSDIIRLPNGDGFQYAQASYTSFKGRVLEGNGVVPDVEIPSAAGAAPAEHDAVLEAAEAWIAGLRK